MNNNFEKDKNKGQDSYFLGILTLPDIGKCEVRIYDCEDNRIPHMHISNMDKSFHTCLCIYESKYYYHNNEFKINEFSIDQAEIFYKWMKSKIIKNSNDNGMTFWGSCSFTWNSVNPRCKYNIFISYSGSINYQLIEEEGWIGLEDHSKLCPCRIGEIDLPDIGECEVQVYNFENNDLVPHFHIFNEDNSFHTCVCIYEAKYYNHSNMIINKFTEKQLEVFCDWIGLKNININDQTNWESVRFCWYISNKYSDYTAVCSDYNKLNLGGI